MTVPLARAMRARRPARAPPSPKGPASLEGQLFNFDGEPNRYGLGPFYELHVWAWKTNPYGAFADMNPTVSCEHMPGEVR